MCSVMLHIYQLCCAKIGFSIWKFLSMNHVNRFWGSFPNFSKERCSLVLVRLSHHCTKKNCEATAAWVSPRVKPNPAFVKYSKPDHLSEICCMKHDSTYSEPFAIFFIVIINDIFKFAFCRNIYQIIKIVNRGRNPNNSGSCLTPIRGIVCIVMLFKMPHHFQPYLCRFWNLSQIKDFVPHSVFNEF